MTEIINAVAVDGDTAYVVGGSHGQGRLTAIDVSDPRDPRFLASIPWGSLGQDVETVGEFIYALDWTGGLSVMVRIGPFFVEVARYRAAPFGLGYHDLEVVGGFAYISTQVDSQVGVHILDVTNPDAPVFVGSIGIHDGAPIGTHIRGGLAFVSVAPRNINEFTGLQIFDILDPANPVQLESWAMARVHDIHFLDDVAVMTTSGKLLLLDISDLSAPLVILSFWTQSFLPQDIEIYRDLLVVTGGSFVEILDPWAPAATPVPISFAVRAVLALVFVAVYGFRNRR